MSKLIPRFNPQHKMKDIYESFFHPYYSLEQFEIKFTELAKTKHAIAFSYGRTALYALLKTLNIHGKEIICPAYTCVVVAHAIVASGNKPIFVDSDLTFNMNLDNVEQKITNDTAVLIATSIFGIPLDLDKLQKIRTLYPDLIILQDCAHSFFCEYNTNEVHKRGLAAFYGMNISKIIHGIFLGAITTDSDDLYSKLKQFQSKMAKPSLLASIKRYLYAFASYFAFQPIIYSLILKIQSWGLLDRFTVYYNDNTIDLPKDYLTKPTSLDLFIGSKNVARYEDIIVIRRACADIYYKGLSNIIDFRLPPKIEGSTYSHFTVLCEDAKSLKLYLLRHGIEAGEIIEYVIPCLKSYSTGERYPIAESFVGRTLNLNVHSTSNAELTCKLVKDFYESK